MKLLAFAASHRPDSLNKKLLNQVFSLTTQKGVAVDILEYNALDMPLFNATQSHIIPPPAEILATKITGVDGIVIVTPEYNWSFPGSLKNIIDWLSVIKPNPLRGKTALLMCATTGARGGILGLQQLKSPLEALDVHLYHKVFSLPFAHHALNAQRQLTDEAQKTSLQIIINDYLNFTKKIADL